MASEPASSGAAEAAEEAQERRRSFGPFFAFGALALGHGLYHRRLRWVVVGAAAIVADAKLPLAQRLKNVVELVP